MFKSRFRSDFQNRRQADERRQQRRHSGAVEAQPSGRGGAVPPVGGSDRLPAGAAAPHEGEEVGPRAAIFIHLYVCVLYESLNNVTCLSPGNW